MFPSLPIGPRSGGLATPCLADSTVPPALPADVTTHYRVNRSTSPALQQAPSNPAFSSFPSRSPIAAVWRMLKVGGAHLYAATQSLGDSHPHPHQPTTTATGQHIHCHRASAGVRRCLHHGSEGTPAAGHSADERDCGISGSSCGKLVGQA